ncbi:hypothetical protein [Aneurinibacillus aneurinilyticus]|uniref:hypothetical protein n=1 Tax=Aneurinibacillus aneurinilyticus TaxID=1391 RepID=UPI0023F391BD|nr:hypothetical protein [Aneurinibacillus aneurinilyticus]
MNFLKSRKFLITILSIVLVAFNDQFNLHLSADQVTAIASIIVSYLLGQSYIDSRNGNSNS